MVDAVLRDLPALGPRQYRLVNRQSAATGKGTAFSGTFAKPLHPDSWLFFVKGSHQNSVIANWHAVVAGYDWTSLYGGGNCSQTPPRAQVLIGRPNRLPKARTYSLTYEVTQNNECHGYAEVMMPDEFKGIVARSRAEYSCNTSPHTITHTYGPFPFDAVFVMAAHGFQDHSGHMTLTQTGGSQVISVVAGSGMTRMLIGVLDAHGRLSVATACNYRHGLFGAILR